MASVPQRRPQQQEIRQLSLPFDLATALSPGTAQAPATPSAPSLRPTAVWPTLSPAQQAQAHRRLLGVIEEVLREACAHD